MSSSIKVNTDTDLGVFSFMNDSSKTFDINLIVKAINNFSKKDDLSQIDLKILQEIENSLRGLVDDY